MILAFDPDLHSTAWCFANKEGMEGGIIRVEPGYKGDEAVQEMALAISDMREQWAARFPYFLIVESQELHYGHRSAPKDIIRLAQVAGAILSCAGEPAQKIELVSPQVWKGQVPKEIHQARVCKKLGWDFEPMSDYVRPAQKHWTGFRVHKPSDWKHLMDAVGLALWGREKLSPT